jgi:hypothetical protein
LPTADKPEKSFEKKPRVFGAFFMRGQGIFARQRCQYSGRDSLNRSGFILIGGRPMSTVEDPEVFTPPQLAKRYRVSCDKIVRWILAGELAAMNLATTTSGRPRYRITAEALAAFEARRAVLSPPPRRKRPAAPANFVRHFR